MKTVGYDEWLVERQALLEKEKAWTKERDALSEQRRALPRVKITKNYTLMSPTGPCTLTQIFGDKSQLIVYHFMMGPDWQKPCIGCEAWAAAFNGTTDKYEQLDARLVAVSTAPIDMLEAEKQKQGWNFDWYSNGTGEFSVDFHASSHSQEKSRQVGNQIVEFDRGENHGITVFQKEGEDVYMTYNALNRGVEIANGGFGFYDMLPSGRQW